MNLDPDSRIQSSDDWTGATPIWGDATALSWQLLVMRAAGATFMECWLTAREQDVSPMEIVEAFHLAGDLGLSLTREEGDEICDLLGEEGFFGNEKLGLLHRLLKNPAETVRFALKMAREEPSPWLPGTLAHLGIDSLSVALASRSFHEATDLMESMGLEGSNGAGLPPGDWGHEDYRTQTFEGRRIPASSLLIVALGTLRFLECTFPDVSPPLHAQDLVIEGGQGLRMLPALQTKHLVIQRHPLLERLPRNLKVDGDLLARSLPRLVLPEGLQVGGRLTLICLGSHAQLPEGLQVRGALEIQDCLGIDQRRLPVECESLWLDGLRALQALPPGLRVRHHLILARCPLRSLPEGLQVGGNIRLGELDRLGPLSEGLGVGGDLEVDHCPLLRLPEGLRIPGDLRLANLPGMDFLPKDMSIGGSLRVTNCPRLPIDEKWKDKLSRSRPSLGMDPLNRTTWKQGPAAQWDHPRDPWAAVAKF